MSTSLPRWRVGKHVPLHVYEQTGAEPNTDPFPGGDRPVATFHDAAQAIAAVNAFNAERDTFARNRRLAARIAAGNSVPDLDEVMAAVRRMGAAGLDVPGPRAVQLADEIDRLRSLADGG